MCWLLDRTAHEVGIRQSASSAVRNASDSSLSWGESRLQLQSCNYMYLQSWLVIVTPWWTSDARHDVTVKQVGLYHQRCNAWSVKSASTTTIEVLVVGLWMSAIRVPPFPLPCCIKKTLHGRPETYRKPSAFRIARSCSPTYRECKPSRKEVARGKLGQEWSGSYLLFTIKVFTSACSVQCAVCSVQCVV